MTETGQKKIGVLLVNLGSPASPKTGDVRRFLREFLGDPRVVNLPRPLWWLILNLFVLPFRPKKSAHAYQSIWTEQGSPLIVFTEKLTAKLQGFTGIDDADLIIDCAMRYGKPALREKLQNFQKQGVHEIVILPLYPQYSSTTTASIFDVVAEEFVSWRHMPGLHFISDFHEHPSYIEALAQSVRQHWQANGQAELLLLSFHGLPAKLTEWGDPYFYQCQTTGRLLAEQLGLKDEQWKLVFQSRFGKAEWLKPYCVEVLQELPQQGVKNVDVICPGFSVDCLETLEEIAIANQEIFLEAGGETYRYIPCLNDSDAHVEVMLDLIKTVH
ncbi:ferrochelatase [Methylomonas sp. EFPC1]|uniref:Ferrochelatase n=1 Tax=Methylomonas defluvii TaxID=3045149 RepID=A0ABU4UIH1_9GAMM|nr:MULTISPECIES: ferrochelatase [unclassified Methylomonas]MDX8129287.1 ferrochelatase [Methylomonas sp. OY6]QSB02576.1 ferrochelatase [Methylomonas sp. EFPC1]